MRLLFLSLQLVLYLYYVYNFFFLTLRQKPVVVIIFARCVQERLPAGTPHKLLMKELSVQWKSGGGDTNKKTRGGRNVEDEKDDDVLNGGMRALKL